MPQSTLSPDLDDFSRVPQALFLVMGGEVEDPGSTEFSDPAKLDVCGVFPTWEEAFAVWRGKAQATVDNALVKYVVVRLR